MGAALTAAAAIALGAVALGPASPALAHDQLVNSEVVEQPDGTAEAVRLSFNNSIIDVGTEFVLTAPDGSDVRDGDPVVEGPDVTQPFASGLKAGDYAGAWRVVSSDGHPIDGAFTLTLAEDGSATLTDGVTTEEHEHEHADNADEHEHEHADNADEHEHDHADAESGHDQVDAASEETSDGSGLGTGAILGISGAGIVIIVAAVLLIVRRRGGSAAAAQSASTDTNKTTGSNDTTGGSI